MAKKKVSKEVEVIVPTKTKKRIQPVEKKSAANKRLQVAKDPPTAAKSPLPLKTLAAESSDDDEEMATEEEKDYDDENEPSNNTSTSYHPCASASVVVATKEKQRSDSGFESETESESNSESNTKENEAQPTKKRKQPSELVASAHVVKTEAKKDYFQRKWSEEDEILLLQEMVDYKNDTGMSPYDDMNGFYEIIKNKISFEVQPKQFKRKISSLKFKYYKGKRNEGVDENSFSNAHDKKCFKLSKVIWGSIKVEEPLKLNDEQSERDSFLNSFLLGSVTRHGVHEDVVKQRWSKVSIITKKRLEEKLKLVEAKEFECVLQKIDLLREATSAITEAN